MACNADFELAMTLLRTAVATDGKGKAGVGRRLGHGFGRCLISRVLSPNDALGMSEELARRVIDVYHVISKCPATGREQARSECHRLANAKAPTHNPGSMQIWKTCQSCAHKPIKEGSDQ